MIQIMLEAIFADLPWSTVTESTLGEVDGPTSEQFGSKFTPKALQLGRSSAAFYNYLFKHQLLRNDGLVG
jgi:hypothetical protein